MRLFLLIPMLAAVAAMGQEPDLSAPAYQVVKKAWLQEKATLDSARARSYHDLLEARIAEAEADYREKTAVRNVKGLSIARKAKTISEEALDSVKSNGTFTVPGTVRRELEDWIKKLLADKQAIDQQSETSMSNLTVKLKGQFAQVVAQQSGQPAPAGSALDTLFDQLLATEPKKEAPPPDKTKPTPGTPEAPDTNSPWFASSGEAADWFTAGRWTCDMMAQDIISIPILNVTNTFTGVKEHGLTRQSSTYTYEVVKPIKGEPGVSYAFRLKRLPDRQPVALLAWPTAAGKGRLEFRTQPTPMIPSPHGFELEAALLGGKTTAPSGPAPVEVRIESNPAGAQIRLNDKLIANAEGESVLTPVRLRLPPGPHTLRLSLQDHVTKTYVKWSPQATPLVNWKFQHESALPPNQTLRLDPTKSWIPSEVRVNIGDRVWIVPSGKWTIGSKSELCGPEGYPETSKFPHYYGSGALRQNLNAPYGCLLVRFGYTAEPVAVTNTVKLQAPAQGILFFDVNEKPELRKDNRGQMPVNIIVIPFKP